MQNIHVFTSATTNYIPKAAVLAKSIKQHYPKLSFHLVLCDKLTPSISSEFENQDIFDSIITIEDLPIPDIQSWIFKHDIVEMCTAVKGTAFKEIFRRYNCDKVFYFDPDMAVFSSIENLVTSLDKYSILLTPHFSKPQPNELAVLDYEISALDHGVFNLGFLGIKDSEQGKLFLDWWENRLLNFCYDERERGVFTDQKWINFAPIFFSDIRILKESVYNVAIWNLTQRVVTGSLKEGIYMDGEPLCFYHFSGFDSQTDKKMLKKYNLGSQLFELREWYSQELLKMKQAEFGDAVCFYSHFENGTKISMKQRVLYRASEELQQKFQNPFETSKGDKSFWGWYFASNTLEEKNNDEHLSTEKLQSLSNETLIRLLQKQQSEIVKMKRSKFWKLRDKILGLKRIFGLS